MSHLPPVSIKKSHRRSLALQIQPDGTLLVKAPHFALQRDIDQFLNQHKDWIDEKVKRFQTGLTRKREGEYLYLGKTYKFFPGNYSTILIDGDRLLFPHALQFRKDKELTDWYIRQARQVITSQVEKYATEMKTDYTDITFSDTKSQWGRCTRDNRLQFSWRLIMAPLLTLNYVVVHELAHTIEKNHSQLFWMKVRNFNPSYRQQMRWLKDNGHTLHV